MTGPVPPGGEELRDRWARKLFHEFVTGEQSAWTSDQSQNVHYRTECYRVVDELLAEVDAQGRRRAAEELRAAAHEIEGDGNGGIEVAFRRIFAADTLLARAAALAPENARPE